MQLPYKATVPDQAESKAALIVAYLILYRLPCHHTYVGYYGNSIMLAWGRAWYTNMFVCCGHQSGVRFGMLDCHRLP